MILNPDPLETFFARAGRKEVAELREQIDKCVNNPIARAVMDSLDGMVVVLNAERQILAVNDTLLEALKKEGIMDPLGMRWGEANHCVHVPEGPDGCGTSKACRYCGAALGIMAAQEGNVPVSGECRMSVKRDGKWEAREFQLKAMPMAMPFGQILIPVFHDISDRNRREVLEAAFLHDLGNTLAALSCWSELMNLGAVDMGAAAGRILDISAQLADVVGHQRLLIQAEHGQLALAPTELDPETLLASLAKALSSNPIALEKGLTVTATAQAGPGLRSDPVLLVRILSNMGINAMEAARAGETIALAHAGGATHRFSVHNPGFIPEETALQIFQRSFSTKARSGRGLGTYAMKILGENILGGRVGFHTSLDEGTEFFIELDRESAAPGGR